jgi:hypothetical protein
MPQRRYPSSETDSSRPVAAAALAIPDRAALMSFFFHFGTFRLSWRHTGTGPQKLF